VADDVGTSPQTHHTKVGGFHWGRERVCIITCTYELVCGDGAVVVATSATPLDTPGAGATSAHRLAHAGRRSCSSPDARTPTYYVRSRTVCIYWRLAVALPSSALKSPFFTEANGGKNAVGESAFVCNSPLLLLQEEMGPSPFFCRSSSHPIVLIFQSRKKRKLADFSIVVDQSESGAIFYIVQTYLVFFERASCL